MRDNPVALEVAHSFSSRLESIQNECSSKILSPVRVDNNFRIEIKHKLNELLNDIDVVQQRGYLVSDMPI